MFEDEELIQKAIEQKKKAHFGSEQAFYSIYSTEQSAAIHFENPDPTKTLIARIELETENLSLKEPESLNMTFS